MTDSLSSFFYCATILCFLTSFTIFPPLPTASSSSSSPENTHSIYPNFSVSAFQTIDYNGAFIFSPNRTFKASISSVGSPLTYYVTIIHVASGTITWSANPDRPISASDNLNLNSDALTITDDSGAMIWSTPPLDSRVSVLQVRDSGNLVLLDGNNSTLWESFDYPTDTIVMGQRLAIGTPLTGAISENNLDYGDYRFIITDTDAILQWKDMTYWKLSMDTYAYVNSNVQVSFLDINATGFFLLGNDGSTLVIQVTLNQSDFRFAKLESDGKFSVCSILGNELVPEFVGIDDRCQIPFICGKLGLCVNQSCLCPSGFHGSGAEFNSGCVPIDNALSLPSACNGSDTGSGNKMNPSSLSYVNLGYDVDYFANKFVEPVEMGTNLSDCQDLCSSNCSCLGIFHENSSGSCYLLENHLGSVMSVSVDEEHPLGYIKTVVANANRDGQEHKKDQKFPITALVLLPSSGFFLLILFVVIGFLWRRKNRLPRKVVKLGSRKLSSAELEIISIPGLPVRFDYQKLAAATENFKTLIGNGGFGTVFKGTLPDNTVVAVKKIKNLGVQGKENFYSEIGIIGKIRHCNLVRLKGFCVEGTQRFLVLEYMNKGSLDHALFGSGPVLNWQERFEISLGTAKGLAYLHGDCEHKIIHCDIKPENILLHENLQVKISDFGLSKLLSPEQSNRISILRGTRGYLAPEWLTGSTLSDKSDVYSYGMILLEIVTGRRNCSLSNGRDASSSSSATSESQIVFFPLIALRMHEQKRCLELVDPRLDGCVPEQEVEKLARIALCCLHQEPMLRPSMSKIVGMLNGVVPLPEPRIGSLNFLGFYGRRLSQSFATEGGNAAHHNIIRNSVSYITPDQISGPR